jgi:hypothetical protein
MYSFIFCHFIHLKICDFFYNLDSEVKIVLEVVQPVLFGKKSGLAFFLTLGPSLGVTPDPSHRNV